MSKIPQWTLTVPVEKSEHDGGRYIMGVAAGPGIDAQFDRITPEAISRFNSQLADKTIPFKNFHKNDDITADLGEVTKAWITDGGELGVEILLDEDNEDSNFLWKKIEKGKQYGLSIHGDAKDYRYEYDPASASRVRVLNDVQLDEISITTRPAFTPSFGTVVRKSIEDAENEGNDLSTEQETPVVEEVVTPTTEVTETVEVTEASAPEVTETPVEETVEVEKTVTMGSAKEEKQLAKFVASMRKMMDQAESLGLLSDEAEDVTASAVETDSTVVAHSTEVEALATEVKKSQDEITALRAQIETLMEQIPGTRLPPVQVSKSDTDEFDKVYSAMSTSEKIRLGVMLAAKGK
jgi:hypothetical protein